MISRSHTDAFRDFILQGDLLEDAIDWINQNLSPDDVFDEDELIGWVADNSSPGEVFSYQTLESWADDNGLVAEDEM